MQNYETHYFPGRKGIARSDETDDPKLWFVLSYILLISYYAHIEIVVACLVGKLYSCLIIAS